MTRIKTIIIIIIGFVVFSLVGFGMIGYFSDYKEKLKISALPETKKPEIKVASFIGRVVEIGNEELKVQVNAQQNKGVEDAIIIVKTNQETKYLDSEIPKVIPKDKSPQDLFKQKEIAFSDLKVGDKIIAVAGESFVFQKDQKEFIVAKILRIKSTEEQ